jgi:hypothetical protein
MKLKLQPEQVSIGLEPGYGTLEPITQSAAKSNVLKRNKRPRKQRAFCHRNAFSC